MRILPFAFLSLQMVIAITVISACGTMGTAGGVAAGAPTYLVGDRWIYDAHDGFFRTVAHWVETHEVVAISPEGITVRITQKGPTVDGVRTEQWAAPGMVLVGAVFDNETRRFTTPLKRYEFPLVPGNIWNQRVVQFDESVQKSGEINRYVHVGGWEQVATPAGTFNAIQMRISMWLDDETFWRYPTSCNYLLLYSPAVRGMVHEEREAEYLEKSFESASFRSQHAVLDLRSFTPGKP